MRLRFVFLSVLTGILLSPGCGKKEFFGDYLPFSTGYRWVFEDETGMPAEIEIFADSLSGYRDTIFKVFFLGRNVDFLKTPNTLSWRFVKRMVIEDREVFLEDRYYPFFEMPFVDGKTGSIVYEKRDVGTGVYFKRDYNYRYELEENGVSINIQSNTLYVYNNDSVRESEGYTFYLLPDTGFSKIVYVNNGQVHSLNLREYRGE